MALENILIINDDPEDIAAMQERLPEEVKVDCLSQSQARFFEELKGYDLVVLDNDANNLQDSKGAVTLPVIRKHNPNLQVVYTSFQPGIVPDSVHKTRGVEVVRTDQALEHLARNFNLLLREPVKKEKSEAEPQLNIMMTYNTVTGYEPGMYSRKLLIVSYDKNAGGRAKEIVGKELEEIYGTFNWKTDRGNIRNVFVYDGLNGGDIPGVAAAGLGHDIRMRINVLACPCDWSRKSGLRDSMYINLYQVGCGGRDDLGKIADVIFGIKRPGRDYSELPMPKEKILEVAEKYQM